MVQNHPQSGPRWIADLGAAPTVRFAAWRGANEAGERSYRLTHLWAIHFYRYWADLWMGDRALKIAPGTVSVTPPGVTVTYRWAEPVAHAVAHFELPGASEGEGTVALPGLVDLGEGFDELESAFWRVTDAARRTRASARLWEILWRLAEPAPPAAAAAGARRHPAVEEAVRFMEDRLAERIRVADVVRATGVSHNHLTRCVRRAFGRTIAGELRRRRAARALHLLRETTLPTKAVAAEVGVADTQALNKLLRRERGVTPKQIRSLPSEA